MREDIQKWVEALESGNYKQCQEQLTDFEGYCCLGVYAVINNIEIPFPNYGPNDDEMDGNGEVYQKLRELLNPEVVKRGVLMNDEGKTFQEIAQMIREEYADAS